MELGYKTSISVERRQKRLQRLLGDVTMAPVSTAADVLHPGGVWHALDAWDLSVIATLVVQGRIVDGKSRAKALDAALRPVLAKLRARHAERGQLLARLETEQADIINSNSPAEAGHALMNSITSPPPAPVAAGVASASPQAVSRWSWWYVFGAVLALVGVGIPVLLQVLR